MEGGGTRRSEYKVIVAPMIKGPFHEPINHTDEGQKTADKCVPTKKNRSA